MSRYIAIRDNQIPPPWLETNKLGRPRKARQSTAPAVEKVATKKDIARQVILELYECPAPTLSKDVFKTGTVRDRVNAELRKRNRNAERLSWDTINRALGRGLREIT
jgi:hypothetical protein